MTKIKMLVAAVLAVGAVAVGGLISAPQASAMPNLGLCKSFEVRAVADEIAGRLYFDSGEYVIAAGFFGEAEAYYAAARDCYAQFR
jgi:hypothetical protein